MCGIAGVFDRGGTEVAERLARSMSDAISHRGPDGDGLWLRPEAHDVALAHRRLAIVDLTDAGLQPMPNEDGTVLVTYNGEIYNHEELRRDLEARGHRFRSRCDTEVLVHLYEEHGEDMVGRLVGMFAFAIWDETRQRLLLARDRLGIKPLYWLDDGGRFAFASEIKALLPVLRRRDVDATALAHYLTFVAVPPPATLLEGVCKLPPGSTMVVEREGARSPVRFWDPLADKVQAAPGDLDWGAELRARLERSVERRMMSDVPVGVFLSGGVDSSTNVALMSRLIDGPVSTFSIGYDQDTPYNEFEWARRVADRYRTDHHELRIGADDLWSLMPKLVHHQDEPIADPVCVPLYHVAKLAKDSGVTVVHVGEGADEILAGYPTYATAQTMASGPWRRLRALPRPLRALASGAGGAALGLLPAYEIHAEALRRAGQDDAHLWWGGAVAFYERGLERVTTPSFAAALDGGGRPRDLVGEIAADGDARGARDDLDRIVYQDLRMRLPELLLMRVDKLTMASAVEARVPFLDHEVVALAMAMPAELKIAGGEGKVVLKRAVADLLPDDLIWRPKQGFGAPVSDWFRGPLAGRLLAQLERSALNDLGWIDGGRVARLARLHASGRADRSFQLWNLVNLSFWFDEWVAGRDIDV